MLIYLPNIVRSTKLIPYRVFEFSSLYSLAEASIFRDVIVDENHKTVTFPAKISPRGYFYLMYLDRPAYSFLFSLRVFVSLTQTQIKTRRRKCLLFSSFNNKFSSKLTKLRIKRLQY